MKILAADTWKHAVRRVLGKLIPSTGELRSDIQGGGDEFTQRLHGHLEAITQHLGPSQWQQEHLHKYGTFALWLHLKDTAYHQPVRALMTRVLLDAPALLRAIGEPDPPDQWYANMHHEAQRMTWRMREAGLLEADELSRMEEDFRNLAIKEQP